MVDGISLVRQGMPLRCLLVGYNGAGNVGSDIRLIATIDDIREAFGKGTKITVTTFDIARTRNVLDSRSDVELVAISFAPVMMTLMIWSLAKRHDVILLIEGSTFFQSWSNWLLHIYLWAANCARWHGNHSIAYAVDAGVLSGINAIRTRHECERMALVITRSDAARNRLTNLGVKRKILVNSDTAFRYECDGIRNPNGKRVVGLAPIEFYCWPVRFRPFCKPTDSYRWPFAFTWGRDRRSLSEAMIERWILLAKHAVTNHNMDIKLFAMEDLDISICNRVLSAMDPPNQERIEIISSRTKAHNEIVATLRGLDALVTSRYHASVLSMGGAVPQMAVFHDDRLHSIYCELQMDEELLLQHNLPDLTAQLIAKFDAMMENRLELAARIRAKHDSWFLPSCARNRHDLHSWGGRTFESKEA